MSVQSIKQVAVWSNNSVLGKFASEPGQPTACVPKQAKRRGFPALGVLVFCRYSATKQTLPTMKESLSAGKPPSRGYEIPRCVSKIWIPGPPPRIASYLRNQWTSGTCLFGVFAVSLETNGLPQTFDKPKRGFPNPYAKDLTVNCLSAMALRAKTLPRFVPSSLFCNDRPFFPI